MNRQGYYRLVGPILVNNRECREQYLQVNCAGLEYLDYDFLTQNFKGRQDWYLQYVRQGKMITRLRGTEYSMLPGDFTIISPGTPLHYFRRGTETLQYYWIHFTGGEAEALLRRLNLPMNTVVSCPGAMEALSHLFPHLFEEFLLREPWMEDSCAAYLIRILGTLARRQSNDREWVSPDRIHASLAFIHQNFFRPLSVADLADMEHLSPSRYRAVFHRLTGLSPSDYLVSLRMQRAEELLLTSDLSVGQIASECGYPDPLYFSRVFKKRKGLSPSDFRQTHSRMEE